MNIEGRITQGYIAYFDCAVYDPDTKTLVIAFFRDPNNPVVFGTLQFEAVQDYSVHLCFEEDREEFEAGLLIENLFGIQEQPLDGITGYIINSSVQEVSFFSSVAPTWSLSA